MQNSKLKDMLRRHEGLREVVYLCPAGRWTIGYGRNVEDVGISKDEAELLLDNDVKRCEAEATARFSWFAGLNENRKAAVLSMIFQLGISKFSQFKNTIALLNEGHFERAADEALNSSWARQTPSRAREVTDMLRNG